MQNLEQSNIRIRGKSRKTFLKCKHQNKEACTSHNQYKSQTKYFRVQTLLGVWLDLEIQSHRKVLADSWVGNEQRIDLNRVREVVCL